MIGLVIVLGERFSHIEIHDNILTAQAGASLNKVAAAAQSAGLSGLEFASGIPGTLGGGCAMNAGAYGGQLSDALMDAQVLLDGEIRTLSRDEMEMGYRTTLPLRRGGVVLSARFYPSAGSVFKRPEGHFAGALIEEAGLKGLTIGGAQVSEKHAGFIVNLGGATAADILALIQRVQDEVERRSGVRLEPEVRILGED